MCVCSELQGDLYNLSNVRTTPVKIQNKNLYLMGPYEIFYFYHVSTNLSSNFWVQARKQIQRSVFAMRLKSRDMKCLDECDFPPLQTPKPH